MPSPGDEPEDTAEESIRDRPPDRPDPSDGESPTEEPIEDEAETSVDTGTGVEADAVEQNESSREDAVQRSGDDSVPKRPANAREVLHWLLNSDQASVVFVREFVGSVLVVVLLGLLLFAASGVWPPMVAVESGSMEPNMYRGDLVFVMEENRLVPAAAVQGTGVSTYRSGTETGYERFGNYGDVIVYRKNGVSGGTPIIHRAMFWVNESENWVERANESFVGGRSCQQLSTCPAEHDGFITKGDGNGRYDQVEGISDVVSPRWIKGTAEIRIPWLGHVRLGLSTLQTGY